MFVISLHTFRYNYTNVSALTRPLTSQTVTCIYTHSIYIKLFVFIYITLTHTNTHTHISYCSPAGRHFTRLRLQILKVVFRRKKQHIFTSSHLHEFDRWTVCVYSLQKKKVTNFTNVSCKLS